ncbi:hypothetical protein, partial [Hydrogenophaga sp.]|uniref:hypothetical protein n=1 Tax=Hydrogenophaga sp. TaxID=1904254 RepID=UPI0027308658
QGAAPDDDGADVQELEPRHVSPEPAGVLTTDHLSSPMFRGKDAWCQVEGPPSVRCRTKGGSSTCRVNVKNVGVQWDPALAWANAEIAMVSEMGR